MTHTAFQKFERRPPSLQNAVDIFRGKWASDFAGLLSAETGGTVAHFTGDPRPAQAAQHLGSGNRIDDFRVLELGPLEAGHTFQLTQLGAREVVAIEANVEAYLKCLIVKEALDLSHSRFLLGDFCEYLRTTTEHFDLVFACGVLYHMDDPVDLIQSIARVTDRCFVWTHYYDDDAYTGAPRIARPDSRFADISLYEATYPNMEADQFWGGSVPSNAWLARDDILRLFERVGLRYITVIEEQRTHPNGAAFSLSASRTLISS